MPPPDDLLPWKGQYLFSNTPSDSREDRLRQRITRAFEKASELGVFSNLDPYEREWMIQELADRLYEKLEPFFALPERKG
jgi:hypothetical protein